MDFPLCWPTPVLPCQDCCVWCLAIGLSYIYGHLPVICSVSIESLAGGWQIYDKQFHKARGQPHMLLGPTWLQALVNGNGSSGTTPLMRGTFRKKQKTKSVSSNVNSLITVCLLKYYWDFVSELKKINSHPSRTVLGAHEHSIPRFSGLHEFSSIGTFCSCPLLMISYKKERVPLNVM